MNLQTGALILLLVVTVAAWAHRALAHAALVRKLDAWFLAHTTAQERDAGEAAWLQLRPLLLTRAAGLVEAVLAKGPVAGAAAWLAGQGVTVAQVAERAEQGWQAGSNTPVYPQTTTMAANKALTNPGSGTNEENPVR